MDLLSEESCFTAWSRKLREMQRQLKLNTKRTDHLSGIQLFNFTLAIQVEEYATTNVVFVVFFTTRLIALRHGATTRCCAHLLQVRRACSSQWIRAIRSPLWWSTSAYVRPKRGTVDRDYPISFALEVAYLQDPYFTLFLIATSYRADTTLVVPWNPFLGESRSVTSDYSAGVSRAQKSECEKSRKWKELHRRLLLSCSERSDYLWKWRNPSESPLEQRALLDFQCLEWDFNELGCRRW